MLRIDFVAKIVFPIKFPGIDRFGVHCINFNGAKFCGDRPLCQNGGYFNVLLSTFKLALELNFQKNILPQTRLIELF